MITHLFCNSPFGLNIFVLYSHCCIGSIFMELLQFQIRQPDLCSSQPVLKQITYCAKVAFAKLNAPSGDTYTPDR